MFETIPSICCKKGWNNPEAEELAENYFADTLNSDEAEETYDAALDAEDWLNENIAKPGFSFGWYESEFFLMNDEWWEDE